MATSDKVPKIVRWLVPAPTPTPSTHTGRFLVVSDSRRWVHNNVLCRIGRFFRPLTGREKQRRISVWVQNVERQRTVAPNSTYSAACDSPSTETTGRLSASLISQQGSVSQATPTKPRQTAPPQPHQTANKQQTKTQHQQRQRSGGAAIHHRHQIQHGAGAPKRPNI